MTDLQNVYARLSEIADLGYSIITDVTASGARLITSTHTPEWSQGSVDSFQNDGDELLVWLNQNLGTTDAKEIGSGFLTNTCLKQGPTSVVSDIYAGTRLGIILSHKVEALDETAIKEARAATLVLQSETQTDPEFAISAKELIYLKQVSAGATDDEIAAELQLSLRAVKERKRKAIDDLEAENIGHAVGIAKRNSLI